MCKWGDQGPGSWGLPWVSGQVWAELGLGHRARCSWGGGGGQPGVLSWGRGRGPRLPEHLDTGLTVPERLPEAGGGCLSPDCTLPA